MFTQWEWFNPRETTIPETGTFGILEKSVTTTDL